ncbi:ATP-binding protein [Aliiglaciecola sp.]|nr:ATP-binding protein [Aliiglaciecola sp.]
MAESQIGIKLDSSFGLKSAIILAVLVLVVLSAFWTLKETRVRSLHDTKIINVAGKQRALTQKTARLLAGQYSEKSYRELEKTVEELKTNQQFLNKNQEFSLSAVLKGMLEDGEPSLNQILDTHVNNALNLFKVNPEQTQIDTLLIALDSMYIRIDEGVQQLELQSSIEAEQNIDFLNILMVTVFFLVLVTIIFVYLPMDKRLKKYLSKTTRFQAVVRSMTECIKSVDRDCRLIGMNHAGLNLIGASCLSQIKGNSVLELIAPAFHEQFKNGLSRVFKGEIVDQEFEMIALDGTRRWMHQIAVPYREPNSEEVTEMIAVTRDISSRKQQSENIAKIKRIELISTVSAGIAHDFNNILGIISGNQQILSLHNSQGELHTPIHRIKAAVERASNLTKKLLKSSKEPLLKIELVSIKDLVTGLESMFQQIIPNNVAVNWKVDLNIEKKVNKYELEDVILNLVLNAKDSIEHHGNIDIRISKKNRRLLNEDYVVAAPEEADDYIVIEVEDSGCGIETDKYEDMFLPFKTYKSAGTGLGLSMVYGFVGRYNYGLSLHSILGKGSCFKIWIPCTGVSTNSFNLEDDLSERKSTNCQPLNIVLIDDETELLNIVSELLKSKLHIVHAFNKPSDALRYVDSTSQPIDVIVTDEVMPGEIQGHDLVNKFYGHIPIVLMTGYSEPKNINGLEDVLLNKPFTVEELIEKIYSVI